MVDGKCLALVTYMSQNPEHDPTDIDVSNSPSVSSSTSDVSESGTVARVYGNQVRPTLTTTQLSLIRIAKLAELYPGLLFQP
jgi:hypothetical protein